MKWLAISFLSETAFLLVRFRIFRFKRFLAFRCNNGRFFALRWL
ncbi:hypothetical protein N402_05255 [Helicobacter pylori FD423]|nr:hypothetical protein N402_05255 [Helicobacter pylori FD423]